MKFSIAIVALMATPVVALQGGYLSQFGGGGKPKPSSLKKKGPVPTVGTSYLDKVAGNAAPSAPVASRAPPAASAPQPSAPAPAFSSGGATNKEARLFAINETNEKMNSNYRERCVLLDEIESGVQMLVARSYAEPAAPAAATSAPPPPAAAAVAPPPPAAASMPPVVAAALAASAPPPRAAAAVAPPPPAAASMPPVVAAALAASAPPPPAAASAAPATSAPPAAANTGSYLEQMGGGSSVAAKKPSGKKYSYAPTKSDVTQKSGGSGMRSYLDNVGTTTTTELTLAMEKANAALQQAGARANE